MAIFFSFAGPDRREGNHSFCLFVFPFFKDAMVIGKDKPGESVAVQCRRLRRRWFLILHSGVDFYFAQIWGLRIPHALFLQSRRFASFFVIGPPSIGSIPRTGGVGALWDGSNGWGWGRPIAARSRMVRDRLCCCLDFQWDFGVRLFFSCLALVLGLGFRVRFLPISVRVCV